MSAWRDQRRTQLASSPGVSVLIFVNYRSGAHSIAVSALAERLGRHFGPDQVFFDAHLPSGSRYPDELRKRLDGCDLLVAVIHDGWVDELARPDDTPMDWVKFEITTALAAGKKVIPLLLEQVEPPRPEQLPESMAELGLRQGARLRAKHYSSAVRDLVALLEHHIAPVVHADGGQRADVRPKRLGFRTKVACSSAVLWFFSAPAILESGELWLNFASTALTLVFFALPATLALPALMLTQRPPRRIKAEAGALSFRGYATKIWGVTVLLVLVVVLSWLALVDQGSRLLGFDGNWRIFVTAVGMIGIVYWVAYFLLKEDARDRAWPPVVTVRPAIFRRAAWRLYERLTTWPDWRSPRPRVQQEQAVSLYLRLVEVRLELVEQRKLPWSQWLRGDHSETGLPAYCLGWALTVAGLLSAACVSRLYLDGNPVWVFLMAAVTLVVVAAITAAAIAMELRIYRKHHAWRIEEISALQNRLGPLVFMQETAQRDASGQAATEGDGRREFGSPWWRSYRAVARLRIR